MHLLISLVFALLRTAIIASPTPPKVSRAENSTFKAFAQYEITCRAGGNTRPRYYEGGPANCRCDHLDFFL
jgi:hypothetical protein